MFHLQWKADGCQLKLGTHYLWTRPVKNTGHVGHQCITGVNTGCVHGCSKMTPVFTGLSRAVFTVKRPVNMGSGSRIMNVGNVYRPLIYRMERQTEQMVKAIWQKGCIAAAHGRFSRIRQVAPMCTPHNNASLGPPESTTQTASQLVQQFLQGSRSLTDRLSGHATPSVTIGRICVGSTAICPKK